MIFMKELTIFTDGASRGNPGRASCGFVVLEGETLITQQGKYLGIQTNNTAEYTGVIEALKWVFTNLGTEVIIRFRMDSMLVAHQMKGEWKIKHEHIRNLYYTAKQLEEKFPSVTYTHIPREQNSRADAMANSALDDPKNSGQD